MAAASDALGAQARTLLRRGPASARTLAQALGVSQPTISRALQTLGADLLPVGAARSIQYTLVDPVRAELQASIHRVTAFGQLVELGRLVPVCPQGFVMTQSDGRRLHSDGLPWWLLDMRPQGYLGRAYNLQHGARLGLPGRLSDWTDSHVLRALLRVGEDLPGNLLVGDDARDWFLHAPAPEPIAAAGKAQAYAALAAAATRGEHHGSSAGGEQPKFTAYAQDETDEEDAFHVIVKFSAEADNPVSRRWRDLLQAEHLALDVLRSHGVAAARSRIYEHGAQRFLEVRRFDREGARGRLALFSIGALDAEFVGGARPWPQTVRGLVKAGIVEPAAQAGTDLLWAFGTLIGNTDMHAGNLSFLSETGGPCQLAPAYDMTPMAFAPSAGGDLVERRLPVHLSAEVPAQAWHDALALARDYVERLQAGEGLSPGFAPCVQALVAHVNEAAEKIARLVPLR